eukprot:4082486-Amphidinium_carterae.2
MGLGVCDECRHRHGGAQTLAKSKLNAERRLKLDRQSHGACRRPVAHETHSTSSGLCKDRWTESQPQ